MSHHITCNRNCNDGMESCPSPEMCRQPREFSNYTVRVIQPWVAPVRYTTRAANSTDAAQEAMEKFGIGARVDVRKDGAA